MFVLQWEIYDAYIKDQEKQRAQEEANKQKAAAKKANASAETAETSQDPVKACLLLPVCCAGFTLHALQSWTLSSCCLQCCVHFE